MKVKDLPTSVIYKVGGLLNRQLEGESNWKQLTELIGFSPVFIQHLEEFSKEATERLLIQWGKSEPDATVFKLYTMLRQLDRDDAAKVLLILPLLRIQRNTGEICRTVWKNVLIQALIIRHLVAWTVFKGPAIKLPISHPNNRTINKKRTSFCARKAILLSEISRIG